ncbi:MAG: HDOD domain-containing protein [Pseudomonadota bacterium]
MPTAQELLRKFKDIKTLPHVAIHLTRLISSNDSTMQEFEEVVRMDPTLVLRVLNMVNSAYFGLRKRVDSISRAIVFIGLKNLRNMIVTSAMKEVFDRSSGEGEEVFSRSSLWLHCAAVGVCGKMISERIFGNMGEDIYLCGILHDIGLIVEDQAAPDLFLKACNAYRGGTKTFTECETALIGVDHCEIGYRLTRDWKIPEDVQEGIRFHHKAQAQDSPSSIAGVLKISDYLVSKMNYGAIPGIKATLPKNLVVYLRENIDEYKALIKDLPGEISKAKEIYES